MSVVLAFPRYAINFRRLPPFFETKTVSHEEVLTFKGAVVRVRDADAPLSSADENHKIDNMDHSRVL